MRAAQARDARKAAGAFALAWVNWESGTLAAQQRVLARLAAGQLAAQLRANAKTAGADRSLARDRPSSRGSVVAIVVRGGRGRASAIVVTREQTYSGGRADLGGQHHRVYHALLTRGAGHWAVSAWTPLP